MATIHLNKEEFLKRIWDFEKSPKEWHFRGERPAIVDFYATWCGPCQMLAPVLEELSDEYAGKIDIYKIDTGEEEELASAFGIRSIPSHPVAGSARRFCLPSLRRRQRRLLGRVIMVKR